MSGEAASSSVTALRDSVRNYFQKIRLVYSWIGSFCTEQSCPQMSAGKRYEYLWADGVNVKQPKQVTAPQYMELLFEWAEKQLNELPPNSEAALKSLKNVCKRLFRVFAHIYHHHYQAMRQVGKVDQINAHFKEFMLFVQSNSMIAGQEQEPLKTLIQDLFAPAPAAADGPFMSGTMTAPPHPAAASSGAPAAPTPDDGAANPGAAPEDEPLRLPPPTGVPQTLAEAQNQLWAAVSRNSQLEQRVKRIAAELEEEKSRTMCMICMDAHRDTVVMPCMHFLYCHACLTKHQHTGRHTCPACRTPISGLLKCLLGTGPAK
ncbi:hypothetical protein PAPYR_1042 [Paratrimastix pyriformis]|uniref:RING-type domain-containing protein n=1 Tax=Paratrimastix pyriformis TaxID=342808 RepID=A0ABQ8UXV0_9EUKA|nr:hypothetical protein PAPYR_1042 [Paratrimastix pyriformis]